MIFMASHYSAQYIYHNFLVGFLIVSMVLPQEGRNNFAYMF